MRERRNIKWKRACVREKEKRARDRALKTGEGGRDSVIQMKAEIIISLGERERGREAETDSSTPTVLSELRRSNASLTTSHSRSQSSKFGFPHPSVSTLCHSEQVKQL